MRDKQTVQSFLSKRRNELKRKPTHAEVLLKDRLDAEGIRYQFQSIKFSGGTYRIFDFYLPKRKVVIEVDGPYHDPEYDRKRDAEVLRKHRKYSILRFTNAEIENQIESCMAKIRT